MTSVSIGQLESIVNSVNKDLTEMRPQSKVDVIFFVSMTRNHKYMVCLTDFHSLRY